MVSASLCDLRASAVRKIAENALKSVPFWTDPFSPFGRQPRPGVDRPRKMAGPSYSKAVTITRKLVLDEKGNPSEVLIPYEQFVELAETYGLDLAENEQNELREALADSKARNRDAFIPAEEV